ncbi:hypothetical protein TRIUR3_23546 [Triticum urartu]|uniref:Uncharacterized protein n=1 Tax=Triticum urartu TaxID=4572 RepID=M8AAZ8_TRIUA|nr:hypothetical protein TRIUR3_23546 [Triticum urartu]
MASQRTDPSIGQGFAPASSSGYAAPTVLSDGRIESCSRIVEALASSTNRKILLWSDRAKPHMFSVSLVHVAPACSGPVEGSDHFGSFIVSGKGDDAKNAEREKAMQLLELSKIAKQKAISSSGSLATSSSGAFQGVPKAQQGSAKAGTAIGRQNAPSLSQFSQAKDIPTYMDDFKYGFPSSGLSTETMKWWGTDSHTETAPAKDDNREGSESTNEASKGMTDDELDWGADEPEADADGVAAATDPSAQLCSLRRKAAGDGRRLLNGDTGRVQQLCRLNKRQKIVLAQVFGASLPEQRRSKLA